MRAIGEVRHFLVVSASDRPEAWTFPKGHIEPGESCEEAALREVREEAGVIADIRERAGDARFEARGESIWVVYYAMRYRAAEQPAEDRSIRWAPFQEALRLLSFPETREVLKRVERREREA